MRVTSGSPGKRATSGAAIERAVTAGGVHLIDMRVSPTTMTDTYTKLHFGGENRAPILRVQPAVSA